MTQAVLTIEECGQTVEAIIRGEAWMRVGDEMKAKYTKVIAILGRECRE